MKMLTLVCSEKLENEVPVLFKDRGIKGYTVMSGRVAVARPVRSPRNSHGQNAT
jgi:hypothetical protein